MFGLFQVVKLRISVIGYRYIFESVVSLSLSFSFVRDASLRDLRANSGDLARIGSNIDMLNLSIMQGRESVGPQHSSNNNYGNAAPRFQCGVLRTNCIDCLDRTNVAQYAYGLAALGHQLHAMSLTDEPKVDPDSSIAAALMEMYQSMGDALAQQYAGSAAQNTVGLPENCVAIHCNTSLN